MILNDCPFEIVYLKLFCSLKEGVENAGEQEANHETWDSHV